MKASIVVLALGLAACGGGGGETAPSGPPAISINAFPSKALVGQPTTLSWSSTDVSNCVATGAWSGARPAQGTEDVIPDRSGAHVYTLACSGANGSTTASLTVEAAPTRTYQDGTRLYFEAVDGQDVRRIALETTWGSSIVEVSLNGENFVNEHDGGREFQLSLYDGNQRYSRASPAAWGWNPIEGADLYHHGNPTLAYELNGDSLYAKAQGIEWSPDGKGGGPTRAVASDVTFEKWISMVAGHPDTFHVHYRISHLGTDSHGGTRQELPAGYANIDYGTLGYYGGTQPFVGDATTTATDPSCSVAGGTIYSSEQWASFSGSPDRGLTLFVPDAYPYFVACHLVDDGSSGATANSTDYLQPVVSRGFGPGESFESDFYLVAASVSNARAAVYDLQGTLASQDDLSPFGVIDAPTVNGAISGTSTVRGWMLDNESVRSVEVLVDDVSAGFATLGIRRSDVSAVFKNAPDNLGYSFALDTTQYAEGPHAIKVRALDAAFNAAEYTVPVTITHP